MYHVVNLLGLEMPYDKSFSKYAINDGVYREFSLDEAAYMSDKLGVFKTEKQMTKGAKYSIFPIAKARGQQLVVSFPSNLKGDILPILKKSRPRLSEVYLRERKGLKKHIKKLQSNYTHVDLSNFLGYVGHLLAPIVKTLSQP